MSNMPPQLESVGNSVKLPIIKAANTNTQKKISQSYLNFI
jgi:hypothetical protein